MTIRRVPGDAVYHPGMTTDPAAHEPSDDTPTAPTPDEQPTAQPRVLHADDEAFLAELREAVAP